MIQAVAKQVHEPKQGRQNALALVAALLSLLSGCTGPAFTGADVEAFQPPIVAVEAPARPLRSSYSLDNNTRRVGLAPMQAVVPAYNGKGKLLASWNPHPNAATSGIRNRPTFVVTHGGHGLVPTNFATALWLRKAMGANVLVLDSFWSRGREENWLAGTPFGANMRTLDAIAAARWLRDTQGTDPARTFLIGDSQGGWTVLRTFTSEPFLQAQVPSLYRAGFALYPVCKVNATAFYPKLGPYTMPVLVFTGGKDTATPITECNRTVLTSAHLWTHYPDQTHGWDTSNRGAHTPSVDGECSNAMNQYNHFAVCRSDATTADMHRKIEDFVRGLGAMPAGL